MSPEADDNDFVRKYEAYEEEAAEHIVRRHVSTEAELREIIAHLIDRRQATRQAEVKSLEAKARVLSSELKETERQKLLAEISCFKDILELQKHLLDENNEN